MQGSCQRELLERTGEAELRLVASATPVSWHVVLVVLFLKESEDGARVNP
jgi:hypothetical protein